MRMMTLMLVLWTAALRAASPLDLPAPPEDWRVTRELQQKAQGSPSLPPQPGSGGELVAGAPAGAINGDSSQNVARPFAAPC